MSSTVQLQHVVLDRVIFHTNCALEQIQACTPSAPPREVFTHMSERGGGGGGVRQATAVANTLERREIRVLAELCRGREPRQGQGDA